MYFKDREDAGDRLAEKLRDLQGSSGVVLAIPRGGVVVGARIARFLHMPLDLIVPRKIGAPQNQEMAVGAVTQDGTEVYNRNILRGLGLAPEDLEDTTAKEIKEIRRRMLLYRGSVDYPRYEGHIIIVDDGVATGYTALAAIISAQGLFQPLSTILAVPVAPPDTVQLLQENVDRLECLVTPEEFYAVGQYYMDFSQTTDEEVVNLLAVHKDY